MASLRSSFCGGMQWSSISKLVEPGSATRRLPLRVVSESFPTTRHANDGNFVKADSSNSSREASRFIDTGIDTPRELWWAPLFNVSTEKQWSGLERSASTPRPASARRNNNTRAGASMALTDVIDSTTKQDRKSPAKVSFTPEKARALRKSMRAAETWHDGWYHSPIATRLAEPLD